MASAVLDRRGAVVAHGILVTVHDLYGGSLPLRPLECYLRYGRGLDVEGFRYRPRVQVRRSVPCAIRPLPVLLSSDPIQKLIPHASMMCGHAEFGDVGRAYAERPADALSRVD